MEKINHGFVNVILFSIILRVLPSTEVTPVILTSPSGFFNTPNFPSHYPPATEYVWLIKGNDGMYINLTFHVVDIEAYKGKCIDIVEIKDGNHSDAPFIGGFCNANKPTESFIASSNVLRIWFQSAKNSDGGAGFNASYITLKDHGCGGKLNFFPGTLNSPRYPLPYPNNRKCQWDIQAPAGMYIYVEFHGVYHLEVDCTFLPCKCMDTLDITDSGQSLPYLPYTGYCAGKPHTFTSKTNKVSLKFVTNNGGRYEGFNATYTTSLTPGCGADFHSNQGDITSPNFPHGYYPLIECIWRIVVPLDHYINLNFQEFDVAEASGLHPADSVKIYDGSTKHAPLLGQFSNTNSVNALNSTGNKMFVWFKSGYNWLNAKGFYATYTAHKLKNANEGETRKRRHQEELEADKSYPYKPLNNGFSVTLNSICFLGVAIFVVIL